MSATIPTSVQDIYSTLGRALSMSHPQAEPIEILLVENNPDDAFLTTTALKEGRVRNRVSHVEDGEEAMAFLRRQGQYGNAPRPDLILLDIGMPRKNGAEVLTEIKQDPELRCIPVIMLTDKDDPRIVRDAYDKHVNSYINKPVDADQFLGVVRKIEDFWLTVVRLPRAA